MRGDSPSRCARCLYYCRAGATFLFSHIGLCGLVVGYTIMGAFTFEALEAHNELMKRQEMIKERQKLVLGLWEMTESQNVFSETNWTRNVTDTLRDFEIKLVKAVRKEGYDGNDEMQLQWSFSGALLYSIIVITTIGYGNIAPKTPYGKVVTILYAIVGIPLMLLCLSNIGDAMAHSFKFIYWKVCCYLCVKPKKRRKTRPSFKHHHRYSSERDSYPEKFGGNSLLDLPGGVAAGYGQSPPPPPPHQTGSTSARRGQTGGESHRTSSYRAPPSTMRRESPPPFNSLNSRRGGRGQQELYNERVDASRVPIITNKYVVQGHDQSDLPPAEPPPPAGMHHSRQGRHQPVYRPPAGGSLGRAGSSRARGGGPASGSGAKNRCSWRDETVDIDFENGDDDSGSEESDEHEEVTVPIWLCLAIVVGYICGGAVLFSLWEQWNFLDSSYFCFVTLTTIGFGDLVPGTAVLSEDAQLTLGLCALYLLFGMALLAMSFNLVQEEVTKSVKCIGKRLGILSDDDEDD